MKFAHKLTLALLVVLAVVLSLCNTVLIGQQFRQELHTAQETLSADWQRESRAMQRTLVTPGSGSLAARVGSYLQAITEQNSLACAAYSVDGTFLYYALPTAVPLSEVEALLAQDGEPRMVLANNHTLLCAGTVVLPERCITLVIAQDAAPVWQARQARTRNALIAELLAMVLAGGLVLLLCRRMTRPLEQLEQASRQIAAGAYSQRTAIHGSDEIASLSRSFDEMAQAVEGTVQTLQQNARQKDDFVAAFTHELKTPMTSILGFADILRSGEVSPATRRTAADYIYHESKRLEALSGNLLALMGLEQQPPQLEAVPLGRVLQSLRRALPQGSPVPTLPRSDAVVLAQPELLCDMLYNLIQNARKATPADGKVEVLLDETPTRLTIRVQDTGCGIPPQELARITEPFYMVDKSRAREQGGSGMGLALCARIAALHGTTLQFASVPSQGTTVSFCLQKAGFSDRLARMPKGLDTCLYKDLDEDGVTISGGEAQKIAIARALYKDAPFIILDEPTAALDPIAEAEIYSKFDEIAGDKTAIYISHRLSSCKFCDEIAVFHEGAVIQQGTHAELVADENGKYYELWNAQAQYYTE